MWKRYKNQILEYVLLLCFLLFLIRCPNLDLMFGKERDTPVGIVIYLCYVLPLIMLEFTCIVNFIRKENEMGSYYLIRDNSGKHLVKIISKETCYLVVVHIAIKFLFLLCTWEMELLSYPIVDLIYSIPSTLCLVILHIEFALLLWKITQSRMLLPMFIVLLLILYFIVFVNADTAIFNCLLIPENELILFYLLGNMALMKVICIIYKKI